MKNEVIKEFEEWVLTQEQKNKEYRKIGSTYIRVSTDKQEELSPISQLKAVWEYCESQGIYLNSKYIFIEEEGISGKSVDKRDEFKQMISIAKSESKPFDILVLWKFSRFARNQEESIMYKSILRKKHGIDVISASEALPEGIFGGLVERIIEWFDEYYIINLSSEVKRGMTEKAERGGWQSQAPFGYDMVDSKLIINEDEAPIVKYIFEKYANAEMDMMGITRYINAIGSKTKRGNKHENKMVFWILTNPVYIGYARWTPGGKLKTNELLENTRSIIKKAEHIPIISKELFDKARKRLLENKRFSVKHQRQDPNPWSWTKGLIRCTECNSTLVRTGNSLRCNSYSHGKCTQSQRIPIDETIDMLLEAIKNTSNAKTKIIIVEQKKKNKNHNELEILNKQLFLIENRLERIKLAFQKGIDSIEEYQSNKTAILKEKAYLINKINFLKNEQQNVTPQLIKTIRENAKTVYELLTAKNVDMKRKHAIAHRFINKISYNANTNKLRLYFNELSDLI